MFDPRSSFDKSVLNCRHYSVFRVLLTQSKHRQTCFSFLFFRFKISKLAFPNVMISFLRFLSFDTFSCKSKSFQFVSQKIFRKRHSPPQIIFFDFQESYKWKLIRDSTTMQSLNTQPFPSIILTSSCLAYNTKWIGYSYSSIA